MFYCAECNAKLGNGTGKDGYAHTLACLHPTPGPYEGILGYARDRHDEYGQRLANNMENLINERDQQLTAATVAALNEAALSKDG